MGKISGFGSDEYCGPAQTPVLIGTTLPVNWTGLLRLVKLQ